jgi:restriction system protein
MPVPGFQSFMMPLLKITPARAGAPHRTTPGYELWAKWSVEKVITLLQPPESRAVFERRPSNWSNKKVSDPDASSLRIGERQTRDEGLERSDEQFRLSASDLLDSVRNATPPVFEALVLKLLIAMRYGLVDDARPVGKTVDEGINGIIYQDGFGLDAVYINAKRWADRVDLSVVESFARSLQGHGVDKGLLITTSTFSSDAKEYVHRLPTKIVLIDGKRLTELMIDHGVSFTMTKRFRTHKIDVDFFENEQ